MHKLLPSTGTAHKAEKPPWNEQKQNAFHLPQSVKTINMAKHRKPNRVSALWEHLNHSSQLPRVLQHHHGGWSVFLRGDSANMKLKAVETSEKEHSRV